MQISKTLFVISLLFSQLQALPAPYSELETVRPFQPPNPSQNQRRLERLIKKYNVKTVFEVGPWLGAATMLMASQLPEDGVVYAIDHWLGSEEHQGSKFIPTLYEQFLSNIIHAGLTHKIIPLRMESTQAAQVMRNIRPDLIYLDASHDKESVRQDLNAWFPYIQGHGILCGDDWGYPGVSEAVTEFANNNHLKVVRKGAFWRIFEK